MKYILTENQLNYLNENLEGLSIGSWVRTRTEEFQVVEIRDDYVLGKSFCDPNKVVKINKNDIVTIKSSTQNKKSEIEKVLNLDFSKFYQLAGLNENNIRKDREKYLQGTQTILFLDDSRNPFTSKDDWIAKYSQIGTEDVNVKHVETLSEFINFIETNGLPNAIIFDNDLGKKDKEGGSGCLAAAWLVKYCLSNNKQLPKWSIVSANKYGRCCIGSVLRKFEEMSKQQINEMAYPRSFNMNEFKNIQSFAGRKRYCDQFLERISSGSGRIVYKVDNRKVLKLAKNQKGIAQNTLESEWFIQEYFGNVVAKTFDSDENDYFVEMELAKKCTKPLFRQLVGFDIELVQPYLIQMFEPRSRSIWSGISDEDKAILNENEWMNDLMDFVGNYDMAPGDLSRLSSYGIVLRNRKPKVVLVDFGLSRGVHTEYYS